MNAMSLTLVKERQGAEYTLDTAVNAAGPVTDPAHTPVPLKPTAAMLAAGSRAGGVSVEVAWKIYQAMIKEAV